MRISAKADYAVRAAIELAAAEADTATKAETIARAQDIPHKFLEGRLGDLRRAELVRSVRGMDGGYHLALPAEQITVADVVRAVDGPLMSFRADPASAALPADVVQLAQEAEAWENPDLGSHRAERRL